jgi:hypothetical protein
MALTGAQILSRAVKTVDIEVPDLGTVKIRELGIAHVREFTAMTVKAAADQEGTKSELVPDGDGSSSLDIFVALVQMGVVDDAGVAQFTEADRPKIGETLRQDQVIFIGNEILKLSKLSKTEDAKEVIEEVAKNSESNQISASASA